MYYKLKDDLRLRGWELLSTGIVRKLSEEVSFMPTEVYRALQKACGSVPINSPLFSPKEKKILDELLQEGILEKTDTPVPLTPEQKYRLYPNRFLYSVHWSITGNCNCRCRHCYMSAPTRMDALVRGQARDVPHLSPPTRMDAEPTLEECLDIVRQMEAAGVRAVSLTGGEALVRPDFFKIVDALLDADILINTVMSNGLLVNERTLDEFERRGIKPEFNMSFDGIDCHDWLRGIPGVEKAVKRAFKLCKERGFPTGAEYCLHKGNIHALRDSVKLLGELGCQTLKVNRLSLEGEGVAIADKAITRDEEYQAYLDYIPQFYEDGAPLSIMLAGIFSNIGKDDYMIPCEKNLEDEDCGNYCLCGHARSQMYITPDGYMVPCIPMGSVEGGRRHFPNLKTTTLSSALQDSYYMDFIDMRLRDYFAHNPGCESCQYRNRCAGGCRGHVAAIGGGEDLLARDEDTCGFFRQGWYKKITELMSSVLSKSSNIG
ncbi:radical SAM protein [Anaerovibrio sp. RM50]|uniref:radical SAM/SPASM domain-containing protein n=1 Tax=Anaerovibrio sp. RM50 TaxID=1200557 RepID=UPI00068681B5|nr:radical SAM protein [Anaerovibrio sp. RM50]